jgi:ribonucleoside-diphosphate reductase alpha chain
LFRTEFAEKIFNNKYRHEGAETWDELSVTLIRDVTRGRLSVDETVRLIQYHQQRKFIAGGRYLYYCGRPIKAFNNCYLFKSEEDSREDWAYLSWKAESCLASGGGIGNDYSIYREKGARLKRTGGVASGPISKMRMINEIGREVMQGGSRRSAIYASLDAAHVDVMDFIHAKDWHSMLIPGTSVSIADAKKVDFNFPAPLDMTNVSINWKTDWLMRYRRTGDVGEVFLANCEQALKTAEPGFSFNFFDKENETGRNACTEVTTEDDSDVCNLASLNFAEIESLDELRDVAYLASKFLYCGTFVADLPYDKVYQVREKNRRLGLGLMGVHEWLITRGHRYEVVPELHEWLKAYQTYSEMGANELADSMGERRPVAYRAIAPTGTIGILAGTTTGIEPLFAVAYKRRYLVNGTEWKYQLVVDGAAQEMIDRHGVDPEKIESALDLANDYERRIKFQADVQDYVDMAISSTINLPRREEQNFTTKEFAKTLANYAHRLRGFTCYPDGARGGQPLTAVPYREAAAAKGQEFAEEVWADICSISGKGGTCGS